MQATTRQKVTIIIPDTLADKFNERAIKSGHTLEAELTSRLVMHQDHTDSDGLYLSNEQRNRLSLISGRLISSPDDLLKWARDISTLKVAGVDISLDTRLLTRIESRRFGKTLAATIKEMVTESLEQLVGLR